MRPPETVTKNGTKPAMLRWNRRVKMVLGWGIANYLTVYLQPVLKLDIGLVTNMLEKSTYLVLALVLSLSGTDALLTYVNGKKGNPPTP